MKRVEFIQDSIVLNIIHCLESEALQRGLQGENCCVFSEEPQGVCAP